jgi:hypothetical protein
MHPLQSIERGGARARACLKRSRSSARSMLGSFAPMSSMPSLSSTPLSASALAMFKPVWPPIVGRIASGFSLTRICSAVSLSVNQHSNGGVGATVRREGGHARALRVVNNSHAERQKTCRQHGMRTAARWRGDSCMHCAQRLGARLLDQIRRHGPDVRAVRGFWVSHDGCGVRVQQDDTVALCFERLARLRAGVVELARLANHDGARADDHHGLDVRSAGAGMRLGVGGYLGSCWWRQYWAARHAGTQARRIQQCCSSKGAVHEPLLLGTPDIDAASDLLPRQEFRFGLGCRSWSACEWCPVRLAATDGACMHTTTWSWHITR